MNLNNNDVVCKIVSEDIRNKIGESTRKRVRKQQFDNAQKKDKRMVN